MAKRSIRAYVELASGLGEMTRARAVEAAQELLSLTGAAGPASAVTAQAEKLAGELMAAAEQNRAQVVGLVQREVESAMERVDVGRLLTDLQTMGATVAGLAARVDEIARSAGLRTDRVPGAGLVETAEPVLAAPPVLQETLPTDRSARKAPAKRAPAKKAAAKKPPAKKAAAKKAPAEKAAAKKAPAEKAPSKKATAKKPPAKKAPAEKAPAKKAPARKSTATKGTARKAGA